MSDLHLVELDDPPHRIYATSIGDARFLCREIFGGRGYETPGLPEAPCVVDVGANIGVFALWVKHRHPLAQVRCYEPVPDLCRAIERNIELHDLDAVSVHEVALGAVDDPAVPFTYYPVAPSSSTRHPEVLQAHRDHMVASAYPAAVVERMYRGRALEVPARRLARDLVDLPAVDLLKIDVVGSELAVLAGIDPAGWASIRNVVIDVQDVGSRITEVCQVLAGEGLEVVAERSSFASDDGGLNYLIRARRR